LLLRNAMKRAANQILDEINNNKPTHPWQVAATAVNTANNDAPFIVERNYSCRSLLLLTENLSFDSSQKQCGVCRNVTLTFNS
jgi:hypothetical protein